MMLPPQSTGNTQNALWVHASGIQTQEEFDVHCYPPEQVSSVGNLCLKHEKKKKGIQQNVDMFFFFNQKVMEEKEIKFSITISQLHATSSQNRMLFIAPHSVWQKTQNHFLF